MHKKKTPKTISYGGGTQQLYGYEIRWVENVSLGLRLVGFADEITRDRGRRIDHNGWYIHDDGVPGDVYRGVVYQLPSRNGKELYVHGYADPNNDDCALLCFDYSDNKTDAAHHADRFAEIFAEHERDYQRASSARCRYDELASEINDMRREALDIGEEMREAKRANMKAPTICATLRDKIMSLYRAIQKARKERAQLLDDFGSQEGFTE